MTTQQTARYTPGPWYRSPDPALFRLVFDGRDENGEPMKGGYLIARAEDEGRPRSEVEANARLIALAPRMADALRAFAAFDALGWVGSVWEGRPDDECVLHDSRTDTHVTLGDFRRASAILAELDAT